MSNEFKKVLDNILIISLKLAFIYGYGSFLPWYNFIRLYRCTKGFDFLYQRGYDTLIGGHTRADFLMDLVSCRLNLLKSPIVCGVPRMTESVILGQSD